MKRNRKNAFTIVEIVIVVAVIAILAAVLIPTFAHIIKKANQSVDEQLVNNLNKILTAEEALEGKNLFMHDAVLDLADNGYDLDALKMNDSDNVLLWDQRYDRFIIVQKTVGEDDEIEYEFAYCSKADKDNYWMCIYEDEYGYYLDSYAFYWKIYTSEDYITTDNSYPNGRLPNSNGQQVFSIYWGEKDEAPIFDNNGCFNVGLDLGYYEGEIDAKGTTSNPTWFVFNKANTRVRGNISGIKIGAAGMYHIGNVGTLYFGITSVHNNYLDPVDYTHHEYGKVGEVKLEDGKTNLGSQNNNYYKLVAENGSKFDYTEEAVKNAVGGANYFENKGAKFGTTVPATTEG